MKTINRKLVNDRIGQIVRDAVGDVGGARGISLMDIGIVIRELQELSDTVVNLAYTTGYEDGCKNMKDIVYGEESQETNKG